MRHLALFAGAGGSIWAANLLGWKTVGAFELDPYRREVLAARQQDGSFGEFPIRPDVRDLEGKNWNGQVDVVSAGFPCQPFSAAGRQLGEKDERNLWPETARIIREIAPEWVFLENSPQLLRDSTGRYIETVLSDLARGGYNASWGVLSAATLGAPHQRSRLWIVAKAANPNRKRLRTQQKRFFWSKYSQKPAADGKRWRSPKATNACGFRCQADMSQARPQIHKEKRRRNTAGGSVSPIQRRWPVEPKMARVVYGVADGRRQIASLGEGWVPRVAATAWQLLSSRLSFDSQAHAQG